MPRRTITLTVALSACVLAVASAVYWDQLATVGRGPDHTDLSVYRDWLGLSRPITTTAHWEKRRRRVLEAAQEVMGKLRDPSLRGAVHYEIDSTVAVGAYLRHTVHFTDGPGQAFWAYLYEPTTPTDRLRPGMLALHQTHRTGKEQVDGHPDSANLAYGKELAQRGYVVLAPDYPSFGQSRDYDFGSDQYESGTMAGLANHIYCVDVLAAHPAVDADRIGVIGHSLGGHNAIFLGAFDERVKVIVASASWTPFHYYFEGDLSVWSRARYMPKIMDTYDADPDKVPFDFPELVAALAPRPFFSNSPLRDHNFSVAGVRNATPEIRKIYELYGAENQLVVRHPDAGHDFPSDIRQEAYTLIDEVLMDTPSSASRK